MFSLFSLAVEFKSYLYITPLPFLITIISTLVLSAKCDVAVVCFCLLFCVYIDTNSSKIDIELFFRPPPLPPLYNIGGGSNARKPHISELFRRKLLDQEIRLLYSEG